MNLLIIIRTMSLERFKFSKPITVGEHAEISHLISFLDESTDDCFTNKQDIYGLKCDIEIARDELEKCLGPLLKGHQRRMLQNEKNRNK